MGSMVTAIAFNSSSLCCLLTVADASWPTAFQRHYSIASHSSSDLPVRTDMSVDRPRRPLERAIAVKKADFNGDGDGVLIGETGSTDGGRDGCDGRDGLCVAVDGGSGSGCYGGAEQQG